MDTKLALDTLWVVVAAALVFFMNAGFALLEAGLCQAKNTVNILGKNVLVFCVAVLAFWAVGYALMFGAKGDVFLLAPSPSPAPIGVMAFFLFQACFAATACSIVSGAVAERVKYGAFLAVSFVLAAGVYPMVGRWVWGGGFLAQLGFHDFAGSTVVHAFGGFAALAGVMLLGPRLGRYGANGRVNPIAGHSMPLATLGTFILWLGWFGFNAGSVLAVDQSVPRIVLVTVLAACAGGTVATLLAWNRMKRPDLSMSLNGVLAALVAITAPCAVVEPAAAVLIGALGGALPVFAVPLFDRLKLDDPVGALSVHLLGGVLGTVAVGLFAAPGLRVDGAGTQLSYGLAYGGGLKLLGIQGLGVLVVGAFTFTASLAVWWVLKVTTGIRVDAAEERVGLDRSEMGMDAYGIPPHQAEPRSGLLTVLPSPEPVPQK